MKVWQFKGILTKSGWLSPAYIETHEGKIQKIEKGLADSPNADLDGYLIPGFQNAHSHAFQYAMAGIAENRHQTGMKDDFWTWRSTMYEIALKINPEQMRDIAAMVYSEMVKNGYTSVAEFHYLHHDPSGNEYENRAELGHQLIEAAKIAGIRITLVPVFYQKGGFGKPAEKYQRRFIFKSVDDYHRLLDQTRRMTSDEAHASLGIGVHSIRAADEYAIEEVLRLPFKKSPFHMHISEQTLEVDESEEFYGQRPVDWFLNKYQAPESLHLVHATHLTQAEVNLIADRKARVVLCPSTEGNLGDGIFPLKPFQALGGKWSIGTDSHIGLNPMEELRILDYGQRLTTNHRDSFHSDTDSGLFAIRTCWEAGRAAMGQEDSEFFEVGAALDGLVISNENPLVAATGMDHLMSTIIYSSNPRDYKGVIVDGEWIYKDGQAKNGGAILRNFLSVLKELDIR